MRSLVAVAAVMAAALAITAALVLGAGIGEPLVPAPKAVVQGFVKSLAAGRFEIARKHLDGSLKETTTAQVLRRLEDALRAEYGEYELRPGGEETIEGDQADYDAVIHTGRRGIVVWPFRLERDPATRLWSITDLP